jgi:hypothetical protein
MINAWKYMMACSFILGSCAHQGGTLPIGPNAITGHATLTMKGYKKYCLDVALVPADKKLSQAMAPFLAAPANGFAGEVAFRGVEAMPEYDKDSRHAECDATGAFTFQNIPNGNYYLVARVTWLLRLAHRGGFLIQPTSVFDSMKDIELKAVH